MAGQMQDLESRSRWVYACVCVYVLEGKSGGGAGLDRLMFRGEEEGLVYKTTMVNGFWPSAVMQTFCFHHFCASLFIYWFIMKGPVSYRDKTEDGDRDMCVFVVERRCDMYTAV